MQKKQSKKEEVDGKGLVETIRRTRRVAMSWNQELKESALPDLKAHVDVLNGESVSSKQLFFLCMGMGIQRDFMGEIPPRKSDSVRLEYLDEKDFALLKTVALAHKKDFSILRYNAYRCLPNSQSKFQYCRIHSEVECKM